MELKNIIYIAILFILILIGGSFLLVYYLQDFNENLRLKDFLNFNEISYKKGIDNYDGNRSYFNNINANFGTLVLENKGVFPRVYTFPRFLGCMDLINPPDKDYNYYSPIQISFVSGTTSYNGDYNSQDSMEVPVGTSLEFQIEGKYPSNLYMNSFDSKNLKSISIYELPKKSNSPFGFNNYEYYSCDTIKNQEKPIKVIAIV